MPLIEIQNLTRRPGLHCGGRVLRWCDALLLRALRRRGAIAVTITAGALAIGLKNRVVLAFANNLHHCDVPVQRNRQLLGPQIGLRQSQNRAILLIGVAEELSGYQTVVEFLAMVLRLRLRPRGPLGVRKYP